MLIIWIEKLLQMLTLSTERFQKIQKEAPIDCQNYLVQVTKYQAAQHCKVCLYKLYCKLEFNFMKLDCVYVNLIINIVIELLIGFENRHGLLANGLHQESKVGHHQERIFISLLCRQYCISEEIALTVTLPL